MKSTYIDSRRIRSETCLQTYYVVSIIAMDGFQEEYRELLRRIERNGEKVIYEKAFGNLAFENIFIQARATYGHEQPKYPYSYVEGGALEEESVAGIVLYTIRDDEHDSVEYMTSDGIPIASIYHVEGVRRAFITEEKKIYEALCEAAWVDMEALIRVIEQKGITIDNLVRAWVYLEDIDADYEDFNKMRRDLFLEWGIDYTEKSAVLPASTCIGGKNAYKPIMIQTYFVQRGEGVRIERMYNPMQNEADGMSYIYQPTFSRGMRIEHNGLREVQISGTASIGKSGITMHKGNAYEQIKQTLLNVGSLLAGADMGFEHIVASTCFFRDASDALLLDRALDELGIKAFPTIKVRAKVCREDLCFEIDGIACAAVREPKGGALG